ncbi:MAG: DUF4340 domain-containing protein [Thermodesulfobacteriota bacterium]
MNRKNILLAAVLVLQLVLVVLALRPQSAKTVGPKIFFPDLAADKVNQLIIRQADKSITLTKNQDGWRIDGEESYPADPDKVKALVDKLTAMKANQVVARSASSHAQLKVADEVNNRKVEIRGEDGTAATLLFGTAPSHNTIHARLAAEEETYLVKGLSEYEMQPGRESWWRTTYVDLKDDDLVSLAITNGHGSFTLVKEDGGKEWQLQGEDGALLQEAVAGLVDKAGHLPLLTYLGSEDKKEYGLDKPAATLTLTSRDKGTVTVRLGGLNKDENNHVAKADDSPYFVTVASYAAEPLISARAATLRQPEAAAAEAPAAEPAPPAEGQPGELGGEESLQTPAQ